MKKTGNELYLAGENIEAVKNYKQALDICPLSFKVSFLKFMFSKKAKKIDKIFIVDLTLCSKCQILDEDFFNFCGLLRRHEL